MLGAMTVIDWIADDGLRLLGDIVLPALAILVPTFIALRLARQQREDANKLVQQQREEEIAAKARARRLDAGAEVVRAFAELVSFDPLGTDMRTILANARGRIAVYRAWAPRADFSGDWLGLKYNEGMELWRTAFEEAGHRGPSLRGDATAYAEVFGPAQQWAHNTIETLAGWLAGYVEDEALRAEGSALIEAQGVG